MAARNLPASTYDVLREAANLGFAWLASRARRFIRSRRAVKVVNRTSGALMIGAGAWVATR